jgi:hypothetical protein
MVNALLEASILVYLSYKYIIKIKDENINPIFQMEIVHQICFVNEHCHYTPSLVQVGKPLCTN